MIMVSSDTKLYHRGFIILLSINMKKRSINAADTVVCISEYMQNKIEEIYGYSDSILIYNGIDNTCFKPISITEIPLDVNISISPQKKILFFSGNTTIRKGGDLLPKIMNELGDDYLLLMSGGLRQNEKIKSRNIISVGKLSLQDLSKNVQLRRYFPFSDKARRFWSFSC
jgi:hypothetical protein